MISSVFKHFWWKLAIFKLLLKTNCSLLVSSNREGCGVGGDYYTVARQRTLCVSIGNHSQCHSVCRVDLSLAQTGTCIMIPTIHLVSSYIYIYSMYIAFSLCEYEFPYTHSPDTHTAHTALSCGVYRVQAHSTTALHVSSWSRWPLSGGGRKGTYIIYRVSAVLCV